MISRLPFTIVSTHKFGREVRSIPTVTNNGFSLINATLIIAISAIAGVVLAYIV